MKKRMQVSVIVGLLVAAMLTFTPTSASAQATFSCTVSGNTVSWANQGGSGYDVRFDSGGANWTTNTSYAVPAGTSTVTVEAWGLANNNGKKATCRADDSPGGFTCSVSGSTVSWNNQGGAGYDIRFNDGAPIWTTSTSYRVPVGTSTISVTAWGLAVNNGRKATCTAGDGPPPDTAECRLFWASGTFTVLWDAVAGATSYRVTGGGTSVSVTGTRYNDPSPNTSYVVTATGANWEARCTTADDSEPPATPFPITVTAANGNVTLSWTSTGFDPGGSGLREYAVYRNGSWIGWLSASSTDGFTSYTWVDRDPAPTIGDSYYQVQPIDRALNFGSLSDPARVNSPVIRDLRVSYSASGIRLDWSPSTDADGINSYDVFRNGTWIGWVRDGLPTTFTDTSAANGTNAIYQVRAIDGSLVAGPRSNPVFAVLGPQAPTRPGPISAYLEQAGAFQGDVVRVVWSPASDDAWVAGYEVKVGTAPTRTVTTTGVAISVAGGPQTVTVVAIDAQGNRSAVRSALVDPASLPRSTFMKEIPNFGVVAVSDWGFKFEFDSIFGEVRRPDGTVVASGSPNTDREGRWQPTNGAGTYQFVYGDWADPNAPTVSFSVYWPGPARQPSAWDAPQDLQVDTWRFCGGRERSDCSESFSFRPSSSAAVVGYVFTVDGVPVYEMDRPVAGNDGRSFTRFFEDSPLGDYRPGANFALYGIRSDGSLTEPARQQVW